MHRWQKTSNYSIMVQILITVKKAQPLNTVVNTIETDLNGPSSVIYFDEWKEGTSYILQSKNKKVNVQFALQDFLRNDDMENIFVYDGNILIGTFMNFIAKENLVSKSNKLTLLMAKQVYEKGAVLVTDNSNMENFYDHEVAFLPSFDSLNIASSLIIGDATEGGAFTLIGARDGCNPVTVIELDSLVLGPAVTGQTYSVTPGGPVADQSRAIPLVNSSLPMRCNSNVNTFYVNKGMGSVKYFVH